MIEFRFTDGSDRDFAILRRELDSCLDALVAGKLDRSQYAKYNQVDDIRDVIVVYAENEPVGCACYKKYNAETAEIKRVFIRNEYRGKGLSRQMLLKLEDRAKAQGYKALILETSEPCVAAANLYQAMGYAVIPSYGQYADMTDSICMGKYL
jgi:GNAT superfamily N-acetyltransferase